MSIIPGLLNKKSYHPGQTEKNRRTLVTAVLNLCRQKV